jgi:hypothetical protein
VLKYSLKVSNESEYIERLGDLYDPGSPFCIYEIGSDVPKDKFLIVVSKEPVDLPNVIFYIRSIDDLIRDANIVDTGFPEEESVLTKEKESIEVKPVENVVKKVQAPVNTERQQISKVPTSTSKTIAPSPIPTTTNVAREVKAQPEVKEVPNKVIESRRGQPVSSEVSAVNTSKEPEIPSINTEKVPEKHLQEAQDSGIMRTGRRLVVKSFKTAITVAVSLHKAKPEMYIEIKSDDDYELDLNLVVCTNPTYKGVVIEIGENGEEIFERYAGKEYSQWREIARIANSRLG